MELYFQSREEWHDWLDRNNETADEAWLIYYKKVSGKERIPYADAVEEALCYGWIDGKIKSVNKDYYMQRFTRRRPGSRWSRYNIERVQKMIKLGRMQAPGLAAFREVLEKPHLAYENRHDDNPEIPDDLMVGLSSNSKALNNFLLFPPSARRMYLDWLKNAKKTETRERRIARIIDRSEMNEKPGML